MATVKINGKIVMAKSGSLLSDILSQNDGPALPCGGNGTCGKCRVFAHGKLSEPGEAEQKKLTEAELADGIRLACRATILGDCEVFFEEKRELRVKVEGADVKRGSGLLLKKVGAAVDIGTTTLAARLYDRNGQLLAQGGAVNPQVAFGTDVISRMGRSMAGEAASLAKSVREGVSSLLLQLCAQCKLAVEEIDTLVIAGNTAMLYFLTEREPSCLSRAPFAADWLAGEWVSAKELGFPCKNARVYLPHCISAFVGADITMAMLSVTQYNPQQNRMLVDIGTNGEVVLWKDDDIFCCATAAGPAFEGAGLSMGMQGVAGAVSHVRVTEKEGFSAEVIGDCEPIGICGSGIIDVVHCLRKTQEMDETGFLEEEEAVIVGKVKVVQEDIRKVQLAKSAICAGMKTMLHHAGMTEEDVTQLYVAGGFGGFLNLENAISIGLLPKVAAKKINVCGNAALTGASMLLLNRMLLEQEQKLAATAQAQELATDLYFQENYIEGMFFE